MSNTTSNLELFKYNTTADASTPFSITNALNNNWDKIDTFAGTINTLFNGDLSSATGKTLFSDINTQLGQKLEAEVLLEENGYIKFNNIIIQWITTFNLTTYSLPLTYTNFYRAFPEEVSVHKWDNSPAAQYTSKTLSTITTSGTSLRHTPTFTIGY